MSSLNAILTDLGYRLPRSLLFALKKKSNLSLRSAYLFVGMKACGFLFAVGASVPFAHVDTDSVNWACFMCLGLGILVQQREGEKNGKKNIPGLTATSKALLPQDIKRLWWKI